MMTRLTQDLPDRVGPFYWVFLKRRKALVFSMMGIVALYSFRESLNPWFISRIIDAINRAGLDHGTSIPFDILWPILAYAAIQLINEWSQIVMEMLESRHLPVIKREIRLSLFNYIRGHAPRYFQENFAGSIANRIASMGPSTDMLERIFLQSLFKPLFSLLTMLVLLVSAHVIYGVIMVAWLGMYYAIVVALAPGVSRKSQEYAAQQSKLSGHVVDVVGNAASMKYYARSDYEHDLLDQAVGREIVAEKAQRRKLLTQSILQKNLTNLIVLSMMIAVTWGWAHGQVTVGEFAMVLMLSLQLGYRGYELGNGVVLYFNEAGRVKEALELITAPHDLPDVTGAPDIHVTKGHIAITGMTFRYKDHAVFENFTLDIPAGQKLGLVGVSGAGKTTLANLIMRFYAPQSGQILIDGQDIAQVRQESLRANIAFVPQDTSLFHRTLLENIGYGRLDVTREEVEDAARRAHAHNFIAALPEGYDTYVGERGVKLSGGQRQRIAMARAILKNAPILILDEATSALDSASEQYVQDSLEHVMRGKTVIAIAHRLSTIAKLDRLIVLDHGHIIEDGTHDQLLRADGLYARLWSMQSGGFLAGA